MAIKRLLFYWAPGLAVAVAKLISPARRLELEAVQAIVPRERLAIDIGASWGLYTLVLQRCTALVVAFEPNPTKAEYLNRVFRKMNVTVHAVALSDRSGNAELVVPIAASALATIEAANPLSATRGPSTVRLNVALRCLSDFEFRDVGFIKIDVEGHELSVLSGAQQLLVRDKPIICIEIERRHNPNGFERVFNLLLGLGYSAFFLDAQRVVNFRLFELDRDQPRESVKGGQIRGHYIFNFLFFPPLEIDVSLAALRKAGFEVVA